LSTDPARLQRIARAQSELARLLEGRIAVEQRRGEDLLHARAGTAAALERMSREGLMFYAAALRRLSELDRAVAGNEAIRRDLLAKLLAARSRQDVLQQRANAQAAAVERRQLTEETAETVAAMQERATGKPDVVK
jgi:hypothetical protein